MILVTGVSGFIGKHLLAALIKQYGSDQVLALTSAPVANCHYLLHHNYTFEKNYFVASGFGNIDTIIHAGAFTPKNAAQANDRARCNSNIINLAKLLDAELPQLGRVIYLSTLDVYENAPVLSETSAVMPVSLYGDSKLYGEKMVQAWAKEHNAVYQVLRVGHVYGPGEEAYQKIIPVAMGRLLQGQSLQLWGAGNEIRSFIYIKDIVQAILNAISLEQSEGVINLVSAQKITIRELVEKLISISGVLATIEVLPAGQTGRDLIFDNTKMKRLLLAGETPLEQGLCEEWEYRKGLN